MFVLVVAAALAHEPGGCPPLPVLELRAAPDGRIDEATRACAEGRGLETVTDRGHRWLLWRDRLAREGATPPVIAELDALLAVSTVPVRALVAAEALVDVAPDAARRALAVARHPAAPYAEQVRAVDVQARLEPDGSAVYRARAYAALGVVGAPLDDARTACEAVADPETCVRPLPGDRPPVSDADGVRQCLDLTRAWTRVALGGLYETDRDCLAGLLPALDGDALEVGGHLALRAAVVYDADAAVPTAHRVADALPDDPLVRSVTADLHRAAGDDEGARWWREAPGGDATDPRRETSAAERR